jgi:hypothetical protein
MIKDFATSFRDNVRERTSNPFFGTFIIVWTFRHWKLVYALLTVEWSYPLDNRITIIEDYFKDQTFVSSIFWTTVWTFGILISSYTLLNISRLIINFYEKMITPKMYQWTDKSDVVLKIDYLKLIDENQRLKDRLENEREQKIKIQKERDELETRLSNELVNNLSMQGSSKKEEDLTVINQVEGVEEIALSKIRNSQYANDFGKLIGYIAQGKSLRSSSFIDYFSQLGLIELKENAINGSVYKFTNFGEKIKDLYIKKYLE